LWGYRGVTSGLTSEAREVSRLAFYFCGVPWERRTLVRHVFLFFWELPKILKRLRRNNYKVHHELRVFSTPGKTANLKVGVPSDRFWSCFLVTAHSLTHTTNHGASSVRAMPRFFRFRQPSERRSARSRIFSASGQTNEFVDLFFDHPQ